MVLGGPFVVLHFGVVVVVDVGGIHEFVVGELGGVEGGLLGQLDIGLTGFGIVQGYLGTAQVGEDVAFELGIGDRVVLDHLLTLDEVLLCLNHIDDSVAVLDVAFLDHDNKVHPVLTGRAGGDDHLLELFVFVIF